MGDGGLVKGALVRRAERGDLEAVSLLCRRLLRFHEELDRRFRLDLVGMSCLREVLAPLLAEEGRAIFVAERGELLGFIMGRVVKSRYGFVDDIFVAEEARGQGIGRELFSCLSEWFGERGVRVVQLHVACSNEAAQGLWRSLGFQDFFDKLWCDIGPKRPVVEGDSNVLLRQAELGDVKDMENLQRQMMLTEAALDPRARLLPEGLELLRGNLGHSLGRDDCRVLVAESLGGEVVGYITGHISDRAPVFSLSQYGHISDLYVSEGWRRKGIGGKLYLELEDWYRGEGIPVAQVHILHRDALSQRSFRGLGFRDYLNCLWYDLRH